MDLSILFILIDSTAGSSQAFGTARHRLCASDFFRHYVSGKSPWTLLPALTASKLQAWTLSQDSAEAFLTWPKFWKKHPSTFLI